MCYNIAYLEARARKYEERYHDLLPPDWRPQQIQIDFPVFYFVSGFEHPRLPVVRHNGIFMSQWGLIPAWVKDAAQAAEMQKKTLNAAGETVFEKPSFRKSIASQRCLLGIKGFYEWQDVNGVKYPYVIGVDDLDLFSLGCIYEKWTDRSTGEIHDTFSIITTEANPMMACIHNIKKRMPLIIAPEDEKQWIDPSLPSEQVKQLIRPFDQSRMKAYTVSRNVNNPRNNRNVPESLAKVVYPELEEISRTG
jgi:putative SOS response-associated peptidase YedK